MIRIKNDLEKLWNGLTGDGFNTNDELKQMEEGKKQAIAAALGEWDKMKTEDLSQDILSNFNADSREVTDAKIQAMRDAKLDTTQIEKQVAVLRQQDAAYKAQLKADSLAQQSAGKDTQTQYIAQFGAVYSNSLGNQTPKSASFLDNLFGNLYADEGKGNYVPYNVGGDHLESEGIGEGGSAGYAQALNNLNRSKESERTNNDSMIGPNLSFGIGVAPDVYSFGREVKNGFGISPFLNRSNNLQVSVFGGNGIRSSVVGTNASTMLYSNYTKSVLNNSGLSFGIGIGINFGVETVNYATDENMSFSSYAGGLAVSTSGTIVTTTAGLITRFVVTPLVSGATGAVLGSEYPVVGNIAGFVAGVGVAYATGKPINKYVDDTRRFIDWHSEMMDRVSAPYQAKPDDYKRFNDELTKYLKQFDDNKTFREKERQRQIKLWRTRAGTPPEA